MTLITMERWDFCFFCSVFSTEAIWVGEYFLKSGIKTITKQF